MTYWDAGELHISEMDEWMESSSDNGSSNDEDNDDAEEKKSKTKKKGKKAAKPKNRKRKNASDEEPVEDSDDGDDEGREVDYISSSGGERYDSCIQFYVIISSKHKFEKFYKLNEIALRMMSSFNF